MGDAGGAISVFFAVLLLLLLMVLSAARVEAGYCRRAPVVFNFGDSNSDTGGLSAGLGFNVGWPNGHSFFPAPTGRFSDGRLVIDFFCESLGMPYLSPYMESVGSDFRHGANFAVAGSTTLPRNVPFSLHIQVLQFGHFKARSLQLVHNGSKNWIDEGGFNNALYTLDIGQNDLADSFKANLSYNQVIGRIPSVIAEIKGAIQSIYSQGGRKFWIHNTGPLGCLPQKLSIYKRDNDDLDRYGCLKSFNNAAKAFNAQLGSLSDLLRSELRDATIVCTDVYAIKYDIISNFSRYGFDDPFVACCGFGGLPYNYNINVTCGNPGSSVCHEGSRRVSWDGVHYTEVANHLIASKILSGNYSSPPIKFESLCHL